LVVGHNWSAKQNDDYCIAQLSSDGHVQWKNIKGHTGQDQGRFITMAPNTSNWYAGGFLYDEHENREIYIECQAQKKKLWTEKFNIAKGVSDEAYNAVPCQNGDVLVMGYTKADIDGFIVRLSNTGQLKYTLKAGDKHKDYIFDAIELENGDIIAVGTLGGFHDPTGNDFTVDNADILIIATDAQLKEKWRKTIDNGGHDFAKRITHGLNNSLLIFGTSQRNNASGLDMFLCQIDRNGNVLRQSFFGDAGWDYGEDMTSSTIRLFLLGTSSGSPSKINVLKTDMTGDVKETFTITHPFALEAKKIKYLNNHIYVAGNILLEHQTRQAFILKFSRP
jgi:hypothetical protein